MTNDVKAARLRYHDAWNAADTAALDGIMAPDVVNHSPLQGQPEGVDGFKQAILMMRAGIPDLAITIEAMVAEGDLVATRWAGTGTHTDTLMGIPATGKHLTVSGIDLCRVSDGRIVEYWQELGMVAMLQQLGVMPG